MEHREYIRIAEGGKTAVLMIHGIAGTPAHFRDLIPSVPEDCSVYNILLDGHGGTVADFGRTSMKKWKTQVAAKLEELFAQYEQVVLVAHSMGTLFSIRAAVDFPDRVSGLFLLAVPVRPWVKFSTVLTSLRAARGDIKPQDKRAAALRNDTSIRLERRLWKYIAWIPRFMELLAEIRRVRMLLPRLAVPCRTFQSWDDELVSARSIQDLEGHPYIQNTILYDSGHFAYGEADLCVLQNGLREMLELLQENDG